MKFYGRAIQLKTDASNSGWMGGVLYLRFPERTSRVVFAMCDVWSAMFVTGRTQCRERLFFFVLYRNEDLSEVRKTNSSSVGKGFCR